MSQTIPPLSAVLAIALGLTAPSLRADDAAAAAPARDAAFLPSLKTFGAAGKELRVLGGRKEAELLRHDGAGCLTHMWFGGDFPGYERTRIRVYVDGEEKASIDVEMGLGHGVGFGDSAAP